MFTDSVLCVAKEIVLNINRERSRETDRLAGKNIERRRTEREEGCVNERSGRNGRGEGGKA